MSDEKTITLAPDAKLPDIVRHEIASGRVDPATVQHMLELQIAWEKREAEKEFTAAFARLKFPPIPRTKKSLNSRYAPLESIQEIIDPILASEGFTLTFTSGEPDAKERIPIIGKLAHRMGHWQEGRIYQPIGTVSKSMNLNQAMGAAITYGQRYCAAMMLNLRLVGADDDAQSLSYLTENELRTLEDLIADMDGLTPQEESAFLKFVGAKVITEIYRGGFIAARSYLNSLRAKKAGRK